MRHYLRFAGLFYGSIALVSLMLGLLSALPGTAGLVLLFFGLLTALVALVVGAVVFLVHGVRCARKLSDPLQQAAVVLVSPVLTVVVVLAMLPLALFGAYLGSQANRPRYQPPDVLGPPIIVQPAPARIAE
jgi:hypothetical protein